MPTIDQVLSGESEPPDEWPLFRQYLSLALGTRLYEGTVFLLVLLNLLLVILETDATAGGQEAQLWMDWSNSIILGIYIVELAARIYVSRCEFLHSNWNLLDFTIVGTDTVLIIISGLVRSDLPSMKLLRMVRLLRLARSYKLLIAFPELSLVLKSMIGAFMSAFWGMILVIFMFLMFAILAVQTIHPINREIAEETDIYDGCERCGRAFETVAASTLTFIQQILAGDSWGQVTIPIVEHAPLTAFFFGSVIVVNNLLILNLILGLIVDAAASARQGADLERAMALEKGRISAVAKFRKLCADLDGDHSGSLDTQELIDGYDDSHDFRDVLTTMGISKRDLKILAGIMDFDGSGTIDYNEFAEQLHEIRGSDSHTTLAFIKHYVQGIQNQVADLHMNAGIRKHLDRSGGRHGAQESKPPRGEGQRRAVQSLPPPPDASAEQPSRAACPLVPAPAQMQDGAALHAANGQDHASDQQRVPPPPQRPLSSALPLCSDGHADSQLQEARRARVHAVEALPSFRGPLHEGTADVFAPADAQTPGGEAGFAPRLAAPASLDAAGRIQDEVIRTVQEMAHASEENSRLISALAVRLPALMGDEVQLPRQLAARGSRWSLRATAYGGEINDFVQPKAARKLADDEELTHVYC